jgi:SlyX protein
MAMNDSRTNENEKTNELRMMSDRLDVVETRLMYQEETIETLNRTITDQWTKIETLMRQVAALRERLEQTEASMPAPANERPPHY